MTTLRVTTAEIEELGRRVTRVLDELGLAPGDTIAVLGSNTPEFLAAYRGAVWSGRYCTAMSWRWTADDVAYVVENSEAKALFVDARFAELARAGTSYVPDDARFSIGGEISGFRSWDEIVATPAEPLNEPTAGASMLYTSGTTGRPKGVRRPLPATPPPGSMGAGGAQMLSMFLNDPVLASEAPHLVTCPLYHAGPLAYCDGALVLGADVVLMDRFDPEEFLALVEEHSVASTFLVPSLFVRLLRLPAEVRNRYDLSSLQVVAHGSAPVSIEVKREMIDWFGPVLYEFYGGTEGGGLAIDSISWLEKPGSVGKLFRDGVDLMILDAEMAPVDPGVEGTIYFRDTTQEPFTYKDDPVKTAEAWHGDAYTLGDIGYVDTDGYLFLCDRRNDVINSGGVNIYPAQIESVLLGLTEVIDCCVVGVPDSEWGERVHALVQLVPGASIDVATVEEHCRKNLGGYQVPRGIEFVADLPRTETGKLARRLVRDRFWEGHDRRI